MCDYCENGRLISPIVSAAEIGIPEIEVERGCKCAMLYVDVMGWCFQMRGSAAIERPCLFFDGERKSRGIFRGFATEAWTHGASVSIGGFPAGQELHTYAIVEDESGKLLMLQLREVTLLDSAKLFNEYAWQEEER